MVEEILTLAEKMMTKERYIHTINVRDFALLLAKIHKANPKEVEIAAVSHDLFRDVPSGKLLKISKIWNLKIEDIEKKHPILLHGKVAAEFLRRRYRLTNESILISVAYHTSGHPEMNEVGKILMIADTVGFDRNFPEVEKLRNVSYQDLNRAFVEILKNRMMYALKTNRYLLPKSVDTWNSTVEVMK